MASNVTSVALPSPGGEKVKFTVHVRGHQWSSARHIHETLQEFAEVIQRNARRLGFIGEADSIQRLQLARADGSDPEELDVDATLEDVIICMGSKQLVAIITSARAVFACPEAGKPSTSNNVDSTSLQHAVKQTRNENISTPVPTLALMRCDNLDVPSMGVKSLSLLPHRGSSFKSTCDSAGRGLKITIPSMETNVTPFQDDRGVHFGQEYERHAANLPPALPSRNPHMNGAIMCGNGGMPISSAATPSPAELAHFLVRGSSTIQPNRHSNGGSMNGSHIQAQGNGAMAHHSGFQSFATSVMSRLPPIPTANTSPAGQAPTTPNIALLAQFLASQLRAFIPVSGMPAPSSAPSTVLGGMKVNAQISDMGPGLRKVPTEPTACCKIPDRTMESCCPEDALNASGKKSPRSAPGNPKASVSESHDKDESSSSANVNNTAAPSSDGIESELQQTNGHRRSEMIFLVNRRSKTGVGTHHLRMSDLSAFFHLSVVDAAKKLGVSQTTLKKACRKFGLKRWPGRKVRSLESTIHGLEHTIAVGHGAGMEELTEAYMRSEVTKLQQEMDQLVHGTPVSQHSPAARTADLYKRLYSRGWRSKYHSPCNRFDLDLNRDTRDHQHTYPKPSDDSKPALKGDNGSYFPRKDHAANDSKDDSHSQTSREVLEPSERGNGYSKRNSKVEDSNVKQDEFETTKTHITDTEEAACYSTIATRHNVIVRETQSGNKNNVAHSDRSGRSPKRPKRDCAISDPGVHELTIP